MVMDCTKSEQKGACLADASCGWKDGAAAFCSGVAVSCANMAPVDCVRQRGCSVDAASCTGAPTPCAQLSTTECSKQPGCRVVPGNPTPPTPPTGITQRLPDLKITAFSVDRDSSAMPALRGRLDEINRGMVDAPAHLIRFYLSTDAIIGNGDDRLLTERTTVKLAALGLTTFSPLLNMDMAELEKVHPAGRYYVGAVLDPDHAVTESEEDNNVAVQMTPIYIGTDKFDLTAVSVSTTGTDFEPKAHATVNVTIKNNGTTTVPSALVRVVLSQDATLDGADVEICAATSAMINLTPAAMSTSALNCVIPRVRGNFYLIAQIDPQDILKDVNRADNIIASPSTIRVAAPSPDLTVSTVTTNRTMLKWKESSIFGATVANAGADPAPASTVQFYLSADGVIDSGDTLICSTPTGVLAGGASATVSQSCVVPAVGTFQLLARVDPLDFVFESNESNNDGKAATTITIEQPNFNLGAGLISFGPGSEVKVGDSITIAMAIGNTGLDASPNYRVNIYLSSDSTITTGDQLLCYSDRLSLSGNTVLNVQVTCMVPTVPLGTYYVGYVIDPENILPETNERDNVGVDLDFRLTVK